VRVYNNRGEEYENVETRLVVGNINLVEKIAALAQLPAPKPFNELEPALKEAVRDELSKAIRLAATLLFLLSFIDQSGRAKSRVGDE
jgi:hypothetical protein